LNEILFSEYQTETMIKLLSEDKEEVNWTFERFLRELCAQDHRQAIKKHHTQTFARIQRVLNQIVEDVDKSPVNPSP